MVVVSGLAMVSPIEVAKRTSVPGFKTELMQLNNQLRPWLSSLL